MLLYCVYIHRFISMTFFVFFFKGTGPPETPPFSPPRPFPDRDGGKKTNPRRPRRGGGEPAALEEGPLVGGDHEPQGEVEAEGDPDRAGDDSKAERERVPEA